MVDAAESTSLGLRLLASWGLHLPAIAIARVRLEQLITCSYLIHEPDPRVLDKYARFAAVTELRAAEAIQSEPSLAPFSHSQLNMDELRSKAAAALGAAASKKPPKKWTSLDLRSMAQKRDKLAFASDFKLAKVPLAALYTGLYTSGSGVAHADPVTLQQPFRGELSSANGSLRISASEFWARALSGYLVACDLTQCYEVLRWYGIECDNDFLPLVHRLTQDKRGA